MPRLCANRSAIAKSPLFCRSAPRRDRYPTPAYPLLPRHHFVNPPLITQSTQIVAHACATLGLAYRIFPLVCGFPRTRRHPTGKIAVFERFEHSGKIETFGLTDRNPLWIVLARAAHRARGVILQMHIIELVPEIDQRLHRIVVPQFGVRYINTETR